MHAAYTSSAEGVKTHSSAIYEELWHLDFCSKNNTAHR